MTRLPPAALAAGLLWAAAGPAAAQAPAGTSPQTQKINELIAKGWANAPDGGIKKPADKAKDHEFMRRAFLDLIGRIPTPEEIIDFELDQSSNKRARLVNRLLHEEAYTPRDAARRPVTAVPGLRAVPINYNDAYAVNFADLWTTWLLTRSNVHPLYRSQFHLWLTGQFANGAIDRKTNTVHPGGRPWNQIVQDLIGASGRSNPDGSVIFVIRHLGDPIVAETGGKPDYAREGKYDAVPITSRVTRLFLGIQSQCTQCHDHPSNKEYYQSDFWGVNAFFKQTDRSGTTNPRMQAKDVTPPPLELTDVPGWNTPGFVLYERRDGQRKASFPIMLKDLERFQNGPRGELSPKKLLPTSTPEGMAGLTRRQVLARWVTEHDNFARAFVNRMWGHLFGRGLCKEPAVDDFSLENEVVHPELLDFLAEEFKKYNYDPKKLLEWVCTSDAYNLSHVAANKAYADPKFDPYFARMPLKAMSPEVMFDSLAVATRAETRRDRAEYNRLRDAWTQKLTQNFGDDEGNEINFNGTVVQALLMMNGKELNDEIGTRNPRGKNPERPGGVVAEVVQKYDRGAATPTKPIYTELFLMTVSRRPSDAEIARLEQVRTGGAVIDLAAPGAGPKGGGVRIPGTAPNDVSFYQDVFWALLNSNEFMLNH